MTDSVLKERRQMTIVLVLLVLVVASALAVIYSSYVSRQKFSQLQTLRHESMQLEEEWGRLLLEQSTWSTNERIERLAQTKLDMLVPETSAMVVVKE